MTTRLLIIRHGQTKWNLKKRYCGSEDLGLNSCGRKQASRLSRALKQKCVNKIYASNKMRALQTAKIVFKGCKIEKIPDLREMHFGVFEGLTYGEILQKHPVVYKRWLKNPYAVTIPRGESLRDFKKRVLAAFKKIIRLNKGKTVAIVCHGGTISVFLNHILKSRKFWEQIPKSASLSIVEHENNKTKIKLFSDTRHL